VNYLLAAQESSNAGNNKANQGDDELGSKACGQPSSFALVTGSRRRNEFGERSKIIRDSNLRK